MTTSRWFLLRMRNVLEKICRDCKSAYFMFTNFFPKIMPFMWKCGKHWQSRTGHRWRYNTVHALCMLGSKTTNTHS